MVSARSVIASSARSSAYWSSTWPPEAGEPIIARRATRPGDRHPEDYVHRSTPCLIDVPSYRQFPHPRRSSRRPNRLCTEAKMSTLGWHPSICHPERKSSRERPALRRARHRRGGDHRRGRRRPVAPSRLRARPHQPSCATESRSRCSSSRCFCRGTSTSASASPAATASLFVRRRRRDAARHPRRAGAARRPVPAHRHRPECPPHKPDPVAAQRRLPDRRDRLRRVSAARDLARRRNRPCAAGDRTRPAAGRRGRAAGVAAADHQYHH